jgi:hypothetical protein
LAVSHIVIVVARPSHVLPTSEVVHRQCPPNG